MHSTETIERFIKLRAQGKSLRAVAKELHICLDTACEWNKENRPQIADALQAELEASLETLRAGKVMRARALARSFKRVEASLQRSRDVRKDLGLYYLLVHLDKYIAKELFTGVEAAQSPDGKHVCPDPVIKFISAVPRPDYSKPYDPDYEDWLQARENSVPAPAPPPQAPPPEKSEESNESNESPNYVPGIGGFL